MDYKDKCIPPEEHRQTMVHKEKNGEESERTQAQVVFKNIFNIY